MKLEVGRIGTQIPERWSIMQEALLAAQNAVHSIFDARSAGVRLAGARAESGSHRPHSAEQQGAAVHVSVSGLQLTEYSSI